MVANLPPRRLKQTKKQKFTKANKSQLSLDVSHTDKTILLTDFKIQRNLNRYTTVPHLSTAARNRCTSRNESDGVASVRERGLGTCRATLLITPTDFGPPLTKDSGVNGRARRLSTRSVSGLLAAGVNSPGFRATKGDFFRLSTSLLRLFEFTLASKSSNFFD